MRTRCIQISMSESGIIEAGKIKPSEHLQSEGDCVLLQAKREATDHPAVGHDGDGPDMGGLVEGGKTLQNVRFEL